MVSHVYKCIFVHIPKTGGESIAALFDEQDTAVPKHATAMQIMRYVGDEIWNNYYKFSFIRNPWDQAVSMYFHLRKALSDESITQYGKKILNPINACLCACHSSFKEYVEVVYEQKQEQEEEKRELWPVSHFSEYSRWLLDDNGHQLVDFIGRFENLQADFNKVMTKIGRTPMDLPHINQSRHYHYSTYYDIRTSNIISSHYVNDIRVFTYKFENAQHDE